MSKQEKLILFMTVKGGVGRTTCLANVAWLLAKSGNRVLVVDGDVEAPGLSVMDAFLPVEYETVEKHKSLSQSLEKGEGLMGMVEFFYWLSKNERKDVNGVRSFIHPVILPVEGKFKKHIHILNKYFNSRFVDIGQLISNENETVSIDDAFWHPNGEIWVLPVGAMSNARNTTDKSKSDNGDPYEIFNRIRRNPVDDSFARDLSSLFDRLLESKDSKLNGSSNENSNDRRDQNDEDELEFDYILIDARAGFDAWTVDVMLPLASQLAIVAHLNQQGRRETNRLLNDIRNMRLFGESTKNHLYDNANISKINNKDIWDIPISFYTQILPAGENQLRKECMENFISIMKNGKEVHGGYEGEPVPGFYANNSDITEIYYNSSLPLNEDILSIDVHPQNYSTLPYWLFTDKLLGTNSTNLSAFAAILMTILDKSNFFDANFIEHLPLGISPLGADQIKFMKDGGQSKYQLLREYIDILSHFKYAHPQTGQDYANQILSKQTFLIKMLQSRHPDVEKLAKDYFDVIAAVPNETQRASTLLALSRVIENAGLVNNAKGHIIVENKPLGTSATDCGTVAKLESGADNVHVATRYFSYDVDPNFSTVVENNLKNGIVYSYYLSPSDQGLLERWNKYYKKIEEWASKGIFNGGLDEERKNSVAPSGLPDIIETKELNSQERLDLVFYEKIDGEALGCVLFPAIIGNESEQYVDQKKSNTGDVHKTKKKEILFPTTRHPILIGAIGKILSKCPPI